MKLTDRSRDYRKGYKKGFRAGLLFQKRKMVAKAVGEPWDEADDMCPNCVTPWKCNGPHLDPLPRRAAS